MGYVGFGCFGIIVGWFLPQSYRLGVRSWGLEFSRILIGFHGRREKKKKKQRERYGRLTPFANLSGWTGGKVLKGVPKEHYLGLRYCI